MAVHTIRLREPWERSRDRTGELRLRRKFGLPTGLHALTRVVLAIGALSRLAEVRVNGAEMVLEFASADMLKWEITSLLEGRNEICLVVKASDETLSACKLEPLVRLEIEEREVEDR